MFWMKNFDIENEILTNIHTPPFEIMSKTNQEVLIRI